MKRDCNGVCSYCPYGIADTMKCEHAIKTAVQADSEHKKNHEVENKPLTNTD